jgi:hypothetical protein
MTIKTQNYLEEAHKALDASVASITTPPAVENLARQLAEHDAVKRSTIDTGSVSDCAKRFDENSVPFKVGESLCGMGLHIEPATPRRTTRLKMTLHSLTPNVGSADDPLTRCTFGAVYSPNPTEEDGVFGKYTPYGSLSYNVRSDIAAHLEQGKAYYVDITEADL